MKPTTQALASGGASSTARRCHQLPQGATLLPGGGTRFSLWAPGCDTVLVAIEGSGSAPLRMTALAAGMHEVIIADAGPGTRYQFVLRDGLRVPDPASRYQPNDVHGPSEVIDPVAFEWHDADWAVRPWSEAILYEIHIGAFTTEGTFRAAIQHLDHLVRLGVTAIEIMPVADFPGHRNWGYDGVLLFAPDSTYGRPEDFKSLIQAAHARGLMVILDVVYNHFGPDGNYLPGYAPKFFTDRHVTPWGAALNFDGEHGKPVREFIIHNALYWLEEFNLDGLRLDAVHALLDDSTTHILTELAERARLVRPDVHLILENEENQSRYLTRDQRGAPTRFSAQWNDDVHHVLHTAATHEATGYYREYLNDTEKLGRALGEGFVFQGEMMEFRGSPRGEPSAHLPPTAFVAFVQNHDQVGNRAFGERLGSLASPEALRAVAAVYLLLPQIPMLFMGEEWRALQPFPFFCDFSGELATAVRNGRRREFVKFPQFQDEASRERIPDPTAQSTFESAKLCWSELDDVGHAEWLGLYRRLLTKRREIIVPLLRECVARGGQHTVLGPAAVQVRWQFEPETSLTLVCNLSPESVVTVPPMYGDVVWQEQSLGADGLAPAWFVRWSVEKAA